MSTVKHRETAPSKSRLGTGADIGSGALLLIEVRPSALPHACLTYVDLDRVVHDPLRKRVRMDPTAETQLLVLFLELNAEDSGSGAALRLHQLQRHWPKLDVRHVEQPLVDHERAEHPVLSDEFVHAARPLPALPPGILEVRLSDLAPQP